MILPQFEYKKARTVNEAIELYNECKGKACYLAGGTDLVPSLKLRLYAPGLVVDLKGIEELTAVHCDDGWLTIGANVTLFDLKNRSTVKEHCNALFESLEATSCETLQMRGTIGGNILQNTRCLLYNKSLEWRTARGFCLKMGGETCNVIPNGKACLSNYCSDNAISLIALSAEVRLVGPQGERRTQLEKIFSGNGARPFAIDPGEVLVQIRVPLKKNRSAYEKLRVRGSIDYPLAGAAVACGDADAAVCVGGVGPMPFVYHLKSSDVRELETSAQQAYSAARTVSNTVLSPGYRKKMVKVLVKRAALRALQEGR